MKFKRRYLATILILATLVFISASCRRGGGARTEREFYMNCTECGARYSVASDHLTTLDVSQTRLLDTGETLFECRECGKIAARFEIVTYIDGEVINEEEE